MLDQDRGIPEPEEGFDPSPIQDVNPSNMQDQVRAGNVRDVNPSNMQDQVRAGNVRDVNPSNMQDQVRAGNVRDVNPSNMQDQVRAGSVISNIWSQGVDFTNAVAKSESQVVALIQAAINNQRRAKNLPDISNDMSMDRKRETLSDDQKVALDILRGLYGK
jgi:hypothetical protein